MHFDITKNYCYVVNGYYTAPAVLSKSRSKGRHNICIISMNVAPTKLALQCLHLNVHSTQENTETIVKFMKPFYFCIVYNLEMYGLSS